MDSKTYWYERETEALKHRIADEADYDKEIKRIYQDMLDACQKEIDSFYSRYANSEGITIAEAKKRVSKLDIAAYERKAAKYVKEKNFSKQANEEMRLYNATMRINRMEMLKANIGLELISGHEELSKFMGEILQGRTEDELARQAGILGKTVRNNAQKAHAIVNGSFHNGTFSDRIWQYQDLMREDLGKLLQQGLIQGKNPRAIAKDLKKYWYGADPKTGGGATYCMERLMRTELARVQTEAQKQSFQRNGFDCYEFICNHNGNTCEICSGLNGKHFEVEKMMPGENAPPMHPNCRCSTSAWEDSADYEAWLDYLSYGGSTESWGLLKERAELIEKNPEKWLDDSKRSSIIKLDNETVRKWYVDADNRIHGSFPLTATEKKDKAIVEKQAKNAFATRNRNRIIAREMMADEKERIRLYTENENKTFEQLIEYKMKAKGMTREEAIEDIYKTAVKTNESINKQFGVGGA